jgi:hypothetical protein
MSIVQKLTEGIINRDLAKEGNALIDKWESTGLLEGLGDDTHRNNMARLLENQAKELLREASSMSGGDVEGFAAVAFPLVRRVFGSLIANDLVSVQPMSLPSGLIFFLDFTVSGEIGERSSMEYRLGYEASSSLFGGQVVGSQITGGVNLTSGSGPEVGPYALNNGYASPTGSAAVAGTAWRIVCSGVAGVNNSATGTATNDQHSTLGQLTAWDPDLSGSSVVVAEIALSTFTAQTVALNLDDLVAIQVSGNTAEIGTWGVNFIGGTGSAAGIHTRVVRRLTQFSSASNGGLVGNRSSNNLLMVFNSTDAAALSRDGDGGSLTPPGTNMSFQITGGGTTSAGNITNTWSWPQTDFFSGSAALGSVIGQSEWGLENSPNIPEIDIKVDSIAVTAVTKKLKAKWTPELGQDLNAYHNLDAEVELTQILSEQIALEIDREILEDLVRGSTAGTRFWSRSPGKFVNRETGLDVSNATSPPDFTGNVSEWYETLVETINDVSAQIHRKTLRGAANFVVCGPEVANLLEFTAGFRANVTADADRGDIGTVKVGSLSKKFDVYVDPYFPRSLILVGRRGGSFLESGYVYAPYVPLQTTPTIFGVEDFVPRKGVMTRYAKKMVRPDMYGLVIVEDLV